MSLTQWFLARGHDATGGISSHERDQDSNTTSCRSGSRRSTEMVLPAGKGCELLPLAEKKKREVLSFLRLLVPTSCLVPQVISPTEQRPAKKGV